MFQHRHLTGLQGVPADGIRELLRRAVGMRGADGLPRRSESLRGRLVANLFFEDSTRTRTSFSVAARRLGAEVYDLFGQGSSISKGETLADTALNIVAMGVDAIVVRAKENGAALDMARAVERAATEGVAGLHAAPCSIINAGDGRHEHPTQALLDTLTLAEHFGRAGGFDLSGLKVLIVGDIVSSRVARSNAACLPKLGAELVLVGPPALCPPEMEALADEGTAVRVSHDLDAEIENADAVMMLRVQFERHEPPADRLPGSAAASPIASPRDYRSRYGLTVDREPRLKPGAVVLHPGPMNRGLEIDGAVADGPRSLILRQAANGIPVRMAVLESRVVP